MDGKNNAAKSRIKVSEDVIINAVKLATLDVKGVAGLNGKVNAISKICSNGPIRVKYIHDVIAVDIKVIIKSGSKASTVAHDIQNSVKENIQDMLGIAVARINVDIDGAEF